MPPVGCCTFLTLLSTTTWPMAITAPDRDVVAAHTPKPPNSRMTTAKPNLVCRRMARRRSRDVWVWVMTGSPSGALGVAAGTRRPKRLGDGRSRLRRRAGLLRHERLAQDLILGAEGLHG